jgi:hypothetical protein
LKNEIYESELRLFDLSSQTYPWNTGNKADINYLNCHYGKLFFKKQLVLKLKNEKYESKLRLFVLSSQTVHEVLKNADIEHLNCHYGK